VSLGGRPEEYKAVGVPMNRRVTVFRESVAVIQRLLAGEPVDYRGQLFQLEKATVRPKLMLGVPSLDLDHLRRVAHEVAPAGRARSAAAR
jgi:alkanesulfonate monooxygenase SsuD/methylene tetrahydromethanopterin reductase-like flavin-dependent oxidoreductase (luciferase family)